MSLRDLLISKLTKGKSQDTREEAKCEHQLVVLTWHKSERHASAEMVMCSKCGATRYVCDNHGNILYDRIERFLKKDNENA